MAKELNLFQETEEKNTSSTDQQPLHQNEKLELMLEKAKQRQQLRKEQEANQQKVQAIVEALLFSSHTPLSFQKLREVIESRIPIKPKQLNDALETLEEEYITENRAFVLEKIEGGYILKTRPEYGAYLDELHRNKRGEKLSQPATEVLAIIAHKGPVTRPQIDQIRGVDSSGTVAALVERGLVEAKGKLEAPGRPTLYDITQNFLNHFGLSSREDLPSLQTPEKKEQ